MKKATLLFVCILCCITATYAQKEKEEEKSPTVKFLVKHGYTFPEQKEYIALPDTIILDTVTYNSKWPDTVYYNTWYRSKIMGSFTIPLSFTRVEFQGGKASLSPSISIGVGYMWFFGDFIFNENDRLTVTQKFAVGVVNDIGIQNAFNGEGGLTVFSGGCIGYGPFAIIGGYDWISKAPAFGVGGRLDFYTIFQNQLHLYGKVKHVRKPKSSAPMILNE